MLKPGKIIYQNEALGPVVTKNLLPDHLTPNGGYWGQNLNISEPTQIVYQNEAIGPVITKKWFPRSPEVIRPQIGRYWGSFGVKIKTFSKRYKLYIKMTLLVP